MVRAIGTGTGSRALSEDLKSATVASNQRRGVDGNAMHRGVARDKQHSTARVMGNRRTAKVAEAIREVVSSTILFELRDPRIQHVTVLNVEVPNDLRFAKVRVSVMGDEAQQRLTLRGLNAARGYLQAKVGDRVNLRFTPLLSFEIDEGVKKSAETSRILRQLAAEREARERDQDADTAADTMCGRSDHSTPATERSQSQALTEDRRPCAVPLPLPVDESG